MDRRVNKMREKCESKARADPAAGQLIDTCESDSWDFNLTSTQDCLYFCSLL